MTTTPEQRRFLFLQGSASHFFSKIAENLTRRGHVCRRINLCFGDQIFWRRPGASSYRGTRSQWSHYIRNYYEREQITDIVLFGDRRPYHVTAARIARQMGIEVTVCDLGYIRPDWITLERDGSTTYSRFPNNPETILKIAEGLPEPDMVERYPQSFSDMARADLIFNLSTFFLRPLFPFYARHMIHHPVVEYAGWLRRLATDWRERRRTARALEKLLASDAPFWFFPMQLQKDFQIQAHSPFDDLETPIRKVIESFAAHAGADHMLVIKMHPLDSKLIRWRKVVQQAAQDYAVTERVVYIESGGLELLLERTKGVILVNSTAGAAALLDDCPVFTLGTAIYDVPGLVFEGELDEFWTQAAPPDRALRDAFIRALAATTQVKGRVYSPHGLNEAAEEAARRLHERLVNQPGAYEPAPPRAHL